MDTSLMALEGDPAVPLLSSGPPVEEESEFSRLIAQSHTIDDYMIHGFHRLMPEELSRSFNFETQEGGRRIVVIDDKPRSALTTAIAGTLCLVHLGLVWGAFTASALSETHVRVAIGWQTDYLPFLDQFTDQVLRTNSLASLLQDLDECKAYVLLVSVWVAAMMIPSLFMVVSPTLVVGDYLRPIELRIRRVIFDGRTFLELTTRLAWLPVFAIILLSLATSFVVIEWTETTIETGQRLEGPFAAFLVGTLCGVGLLALLRAPREESFRIVVDTETHEIEFAPATPNNNIRSPPPQAFRHAWDIEEEEEDAPLMTVLEDEARSPRPTPRQAVTTPNRTRTGDSTPELIDEEASIRRQYPPGLTYWNKFTVFQLGLMSVVFLIPSFYLPLLHFSASGMASDFVKEESLHLYLWELPKYLWAQGRECGTSMWILTLLGTFFMATVLVLPMVATFQGVLAWLGEGAWSTRSYVWLYAIHPCLGGLVFSLALLTTVPVLSSLSALIYDENSSIFCHGLNGSPCLRVNGHMLSGSFFYLAQAVCLEAFVTLTLRWSNKRR